MMYQTINSSQTVLSRLCVTVNQLQQAYNEIRSELQRFNAAQSQVKPSGTAPPGKASEFKVDFKVRLDAMANDIDCLRKDVAILQVSTPVGTCPPLQQQGVKDIDAAVRRECEACMRKQRDLIEALLTAKCERLIVRSVQDAGQDLRRELADMVEPLSNGLDRLERALACRRPPACSGGPTDDEVHSGDAAPASNCEVCSSDAASAAALDATEGVASESGSTDVEISIKKSSAKGRSGGGKRQSSR